jgi:amino acid transporter
MPDASVEEILIFGKEHTPPAPGLDVEQGDVGILVHAAPLARKLKGRHMQMIVIGNLLEYN